MENMSIKSEVSDDGVTYYRIAKEVIGRVDTTDDGFPVLEYLADIVNKSIISTDEKIKSLQSILIERTIKHITITYTHNNEALFCTINSQGMDKDMFCDCISKQINDIENASLHDVFRGLCNAKFEFKGLLQITLSHVNCFTRTVTTLCDGNVVSSTWNDETVDTKSTPILSYLVLNYKGCIEEKAPDKDRTYVLNIGNGISLIFYHEKDVVNIYHKGTVIGVFKYRYGIMNSIDSYLRSKRLDMDDIPAIISMLNELDKKYKLNIVYRKEK